MNLQCSCRVLTAAQNLMKTSMLGLLEAHVFAVWVGERSLWELAVSVAVIGSVLGPGYCTLESDLPPLVICIGLKGS